MNSHYSMIIQWCDVDQAFLVTLPEFTTVMMPCTHGKTYEEAARNGAEVIELLLEDMRASDEPLPEPKLFHFEDEKIANEVFSSPT